MGESFEVVDSKVSPEVLVNGITEHTTLPFQLKESPVENFRPLRVICIGAGYSGLYLAIRIPQRLRNVELTVYEKNADIGGTWFENRYPGCACDIPAHSYQYSFDPNPNWSSFYAPAKEIHAYLKSIAAKYSAERFIKCSHQVLACKWDEELSKWRVKVGELLTGKVFEDEADVLITARGELNNIKWPDIEGLASFEGKLLHSAAWDEDYDYSNKNIGVIGGGSSAIQIVPSLQKLPGTHISSFQRARTWISPPFGEHVMEILDLDHSEFTAEDHAKWIQDPVQYLQFRKIIEQDSNAIYPACLKDSEIQKSSCIDFAVKMRDRLTSKPEIADSLIPSFAVGCRRLTPGVGYLEALCASNVDYISTRIKNVNKSSIGLVDGTEVPLDVLVCATGFQVSAPPPFPVFGHNGLSLEERWSPMQESYLSVAVDGFPNLFMMMGPNAGTGTGSLTIMIESFGDYIVKCIRKIQKEDIKSMTVKKGRVEDFQEICGEYFKRTVYLDDCRSWYRSLNGAGDRIIGLWPGSTMHCIEATRSPRWEDFDYEYVQEDPAAHNDKRRNNLLKWLGNGMSDLQMRKDGDLAWYLEPKLQDLPASPNPERSWEYEKRAFSH